MARQVLPIVGAIIGGIYGGGTGAQIGFTIGSLIGNEIDPQHIAGPRLQEFPVMGTTEGAYRSVVYGTCVVRQCQLLDWGPIEDVTTEERQGKGSGPVLEGQRLYQTYAVGIGEPVEAIRYIKRNGVMVYDVRPGSTILEASAEFAQRYRFHNGAEDQLPDPDLEALPENGVGNTPAYRGTAYFVMIRDDLTDERGVIPTFEVECSTNATERPDATLITDHALYGGDAGDMSIIDANLWGGSTPVDRSISVSPGGRYVVAGLSSAPYMHLREWNPDTQTYDVIALPATAPTVLVQHTAWSGDGQYLAVSQHSAGSFILYRIVDGVFTALANPASVYAPISLAISADGTKLAVAGPNLSSTVYLYPIIGDVLAEPTAAASTVNLFGHTAMAFSPDGLWLACGGNQGLEVFRTASAQIELWQSEFTSPDCGWSVAWSAGGNHIYTLAAVAVSGNTLAIWNWNAAALIHEALAFGSYPASQPSTPWDMAVRIRGDYMAIAEADTTIKVYEISDNGAALTLAATQPPAAAGGMAQVAWGEGTIGTVVGDGVTLESIVADVCDRCGIPTAKQDLSALTDEVRGVTLGGGYTGAGSVTTLMPVFLFDLAQPDKQLVAVKRGAAAVETLIEAQLVDLPDENVLRGQDIEYPRTLLLKYLDPEQDYAAPAAPVARRSPDIRVRGEATVEIPVSLNRTEAVRAADRMLKVMWEDLNGEAKFSLPLGPFAWLSPTDVIGLTLRGAVYRLRVDKIEESAGVLSVTARRDRQSAYTSALTPMPLPAPTPPSATLPGVTQVAIINGPGIIDADDKLGVRIGVSGLAGKAWTGANVSYRVQGTTAWTNAGNLKVRAVMGSLLAALPAASEFYTDTTNQLKVGLLRSDELESVTDVELLSDGNAAAIVFADGTAELVQFRDVVDEGNSNWTLTHLLRGRLATTPGPHLAGTRFVMLDGTTFVPLPSSLIGATLEFRITSLGTSPETAPIYTLLWDPVVSQTEFPAAYLALERGGGTIDGAWSPRHRFGSDVNPVASAEFRGFRVTLDDGATTETFDTATPEFSRSDAAFSGPIDVTVEQLNRYTGAGPEIMETA